MSSIFNSSSSSIIVPIEESSRLLKPVLNIKMRVDQNIREKTNKETEKITKKTKLANLEAKEKVLSDLKNRLKVNQVERERQVNAWIQKTKNCPYRLDQNEVDMQAMERGRERNKKKKFLRDRKKLIKNMNGEPNMEFYTENLKNSLTTEQILAMEHLTLLKTLNKLKNEENTLSKFLHKDCDDTELKFAHIAMKRSYDRARARTADSALLSTQSSFNDLNFNDNSMMSSNSNNHNHNHNNNSNNNNTQLSPLMLSWSNLSAPKVDASRARQWKKMDMTIYAADGKWNESGQFVPVRKDTDRLGLMSSHYARVTGDTAPEVLTRRRKTDILKLEVT